MQRILSVDPGLHGLGCGIFENGVLVAGWYSPTSGRGRGPGRWQEVVENAFGPLRGTHFDQVVVEVMQVYGGGSRGHKYPDPADILEVQGVSGAIAGYFLAPTQCVGYLPREWKGSVPQHVYAGRIDAYLRSRGWQDACLPVSQYRRHDMLHGIGLGLHHLGLVPGGRTGFKRGRPKHSGVANRQQPERVEDVGTHGGGVGVARLG